MDELIKIMFTVLLLAENSSVDNKEENAIGLYQMRPIYVEDVNRILKLWKDPREFVHEDARDAKKAQEMIKVYLTYYGNKHRIHVGRMPTARILGRIHNGGPKGYTKSSTIEYGQRCHNIYMQYLMEERGL